MYIYIYFLYSFKIESLLLYKRYSLPLRVRASEQNIAIVKVEFI